MSKATLCGGRFPIISNLKNEALIMELYHWISSRKDYIAVVGLGYVGLPLAVAFAKYAKVIGFDSNMEKIALYEKGIDPTKELGNEAVKKTTVEFTHDATRLKGASFIIVAVPTPINGDKTPNLDPVISACRVVGQQMSRGIIVCFESTVYPGVTEDICVPILEKESGLKCGVDFKVAYSPERINPGDKIHRLANITKIVSGMDEETLNTVAQVYSMIITAGVHRASSIKVAEAAKLVENAQRDINIAFMNELAMVFNEMKINTAEVIEAMNTKWNALGFYPGLVGGHCIGIDPYYFIYKAELLGYHSQIIAAGRKVNDGMSRYISDAIIKEMILAGKRINGSVVYIMGCTFKEDCQDVRNSKPLEVFDYLKEYKMNVKIVDPCADVTGLETRYRDSLVDIKDVKDADCVVFMVAHKAFKKLTPKKIAGFYKCDVNANVLMDIKSIFAARTMEKAGFWYWSL